jgi:hypothetical protein
MKLLEGQTQFEDTFDTELFVQNAGVIAVPAGGVNVFDLALGNILFQGTIFLDLAITINNGPAVSTLQLNINTLIGTAQLRHSINPNAVISHCGVPAGANWDFAGTFKWQVLSAGTATFRLTASCSGGGGTIFAGTASMYARRYI